MLPVEKVAELRLTRPEGVTETPRIEAASGLAIIDRNVFVVADNETYLAVFPDMGAAEGHTVPFLHDDYPDDLEERKKDKPDLESLTPLPAFDRFEHGGIIALGSGSKSGRDRAAFAVLGADCAVESAIQIDAAPLMRELQDRIPGLNLEGTAITDENFRILQRGNESGSFNAHIDLNLNGLCDAIANGHALDEGLVTNIVRHELGQIHGVDLCFSDADTLPDGTIVFSASAEIDNGGSDGDFTGSSVGMMRPDGDIFMLEPIEVRTKVEGLAATEQDNTVHAYMVTDEDNPDRPSALLETIIEL